jgi:hypothetical protein
MANPNKTVFEARQRKTFSCTDEYVFNTKEEAEKWLESKEGDRKSVKSFKIGPRNNPTTKYVARVYSR